MSTRRTIDIDINTNADQAAQQFETLATGVKKAADSADNLDAKFEDVFQGIEPLTTRSVLPFRFTLKLYENSG